MSTQTLHARINARIPQKMLEILAEHGPMERPDLAKLLKAWDGTVKAYSYDLLNADMLHIIHRRRDKYGLEIPTYAYGPGKSVPTLPRLNASNKNRVMDARINELPLPRIPAPLPIERWALGLTI